nr:hypothetical protein [Tanacetum cinerariifolium]
MDRLQEVVLSSVFPSSGAGALEERVSFPTPDKRGGNDNHRGNNNYSGSNNRLNFKSMQSSSIHEHDPNT